MWLCYQWEEEHLRESGQWYQGMVTPESVESLAPEDAPAVIDALPWHFYGGSYFRTAGRKGVGRIC